MTITIVVSLYTSRVVLNVLGASDYGLYNVVGGVVAFMGFLNGTMATATQRFLNYEKGVGQVDKLKRIFGTSLFIHRMLALIIFVVAETLGLWLLNSRINIEPDRMGAANWVYQCSVLSLILSVLSVPYNAIIIANEKMSAFAYISILEVVLKLLTVVGLLFFGSDKLKLYATSILVVTLIVRAVYGYYATRNFEECRTKVVADKDFFRHMLSFSGWTVFSHLSIALRIQGINIILNVFFGTLINATQAIAVQVNTAITGFVTNFTQAVNPQIVKNYAAGDLERMRQLIMYGARFSFFLILFFSLPILVETPMVLKIWLKDPPDYTSIFVRLILVQSLIESLSAVLVTAQSATGKVKNYHLALSSIGLLNLPISYLLLKAGHQPYVTLYVSILISAAIGMVRLMFLRKSINLSIRKFATNVILKCFFVSLLAAALPFFLQTQLSPTLANGLIICAVSCLSVLAAIFFVGFDKDERIRVMDIIIQKLPQKKHQKLTNDQMASKDLQL